MELQEKTFVTHELLKSIYKKTFTSIEYKNSLGKITKYWIGINSIDIDNRKLSVYGFNVGKKQRADFDYGISLDSIISACSIDETFYETKESLELQNDIRTNPDKYISIFHGKTDNLKILNYLEECVILNNTPYLPDDKFTLIEKIDDSALKNKSIELTDDQFYEIIEKIDKKLLNKKEDISTKTLHLCLNILSIHDPKKGKYVLAYRKLNLDIKNQSLIPDDEITFCKTFGNLQTDDNGQEEVIKSDINEYLDNGDLYLLEDFETNQETIKNLIAERLSYSIVVDDNPYIFPLQRKLVFNLKKEIEAVVKMQEENNYSEPIKAFLGKLVTLPSEENETPIVLLDKYANLDQLVAIQNAMKNPVSYIQGPPGTGKTSTIVNIILTAFFNNKSVLFTSYNNKPINGVVEKLSKITYKNREPLFPFLVIGNNKLIPENLANVKHLLQVANKETVYSDKLELKKTQEIENTKQISVLLEEYKKQQDLKNTIDVLDPLIDATKDSFEFSLVFSGTTPSQLQAELNAMNKIDCEKTVEMINKNKDGFFMFMYFKAVQHLQLLNQEEYSDFVEIINLKNTEKQVSEFNKYIAADENIVKLQRVFPIILSTCISSRKIGSPTQFFDMTIMDEAGQCDTATSLIPILRGKNLLLVGDPQQLNPVTLLDKEIDEKLKQQYQVPESYDFLNNSIYKTYISNDHVSSETLLSHHYRCAPKIINFNNKKYYNNKLNIDTSADKTDCLDFVSIPNDETTERNQAPKEIDYIVNFVKENQNKSIGIITPFRTQKNAIIEKLKQESINVEKEDSKVSCGTVHSFQGDEKDIILFSLSITDKTGKGTYKWLKTNRELINVATSRAKDKLVLIGSKENIERLHNENPEKDDLYELFNYVNKNGNYNEITQLDPLTVACGMRPYSTATEQAFMNTLSEALSNINLNKKIYARHEVPLSALFNNSIIPAELKQYFLMAKFDFVVFDGSQKFSPEQPLFAFEIDGIEHELDEVVKKRDKKKEELCALRKFRLIRIPNNYARRYVYVKNILSKFFVDK